MTAGGIGAVESILMIQYRYHTNQHPIVSLLLSKGHDVEFLALEREKQEEYSAIKPDVIRYSIVFLAIERIARQYIGQRFRYRYGFPPLLWYYEYINNNDPDMIIIKDYYVISLVTIVYAKLLDTEIVFYDQAPVYASNTSYTKRYIAYVMYYFIHRERFPRFSPVLGDPSSGYAVAKSYYIPFAAYSDLDIEDRKYITDNEISIIMIGKLHSRRKNHLMLISVIEDLAKKYDISLTIIGSIYDTNNYHYNRIKDTIRERDLSDIVRIKENITYKRVQQEYREHDIYVLASKNETAAVSHLEAMSEGLPIICSSTNGTSSYVHHGGNGFLVDCDSQSDLQKKLERLVSSPEMIRDFGRQSYHLAHTEFSPDRFYQRLSWLVEEEFQFSDSREGH
jgi:glycosyltransferase involved in cell wall biosynthesis